MRIKFNVLNTELKGLQFEADKDNIRVGRSRKNDLVLKQKSVSRVHAELVIRDGKVTVEDIGSRNRTDVDGRRISGRTPVEHGNIVSFGDVAVQVAFPDRERPAGEDLEETPPGGVVVPGPETESEEPPPEEQTQEAPDGGPMTALAPAQPAALAPKPAAPLAPAERGGLPAIEEHAARVQQALWPALTLIMGVTAAVLLIFAFIQRGGGADAPVSTVGVALRVGEEKVVQVRRGFVRRPEVERSEIVMVSFPLNLDVAVQFTGMKAGLTTVRLYNGTGQHIEVHVNVLPREREDVEQVFVDVPRTDQERIARAVQAMQRGRAMEEQNDPYEAMLQYKEAIALLEPFAARPNREYNEAWGRFNKAKETIQSRYDALWREAGDFIKDGDKAMALVRLGEIQALIHDTEDVRRQNVDLLMDLLQRMIEVEKKSSRRTL